MSKETTLVRVFKADSLRINDAIKNHKLNKENALSEAINNWCDEIQESTSEKK